MKLKELALSLNNWLNYNAVIGKTFMMSESSFKYPFVDYLVNAGRVPLSSVNLEYGHPCFRQRRVDLVLEEKLDNVSVIKAAFEFKVSVPYFDSQRLFNDLLRLWHLSALNPETRSYFVLAGLLDDFGAVMNLGLISNSSDLVKLLLPNTVDSRFQVEIATSDNELIVNAVKSFKDEYQSGFKGTLGHVLIPDSISIECNYISAYDIELNHYMVGIWSVS